LKKAQRTEIPRVLVHCCSNETTYNPFYALVAKRLCSPSGTPQVARVVRMGLQFNLWGVFREWGESTEDAEWADDQDETLDDAAKLRKAVNLGKLYGTLVADGVISLQILKVTLLFVLVGLTTGLGIYKFTALDQNIPRNLLYATHSAFSGK
jgi:nucleolar MIF4G domain-containing protein 1